MVVLTRLGSPALDGQIQARQMRQHGMAALHFSRRRLQLHIIWRIKLHPLGHLRLIETELPAQGGQVEGLAHACIPFPPT